jgi:hypothetical protein
VALFPSAPVSNIGYHAAMPQADAELVDRGKIRRFHRSGEIGFSLQRSDQNKLNNGFFDTISLTADLARNHFPAAGTMIQAAILAAGVNAAWRSQKCPDVR